MNDELVKRLREIHPEEFGDAWDFAFACQRAMHEAADAIEELSLTAESYKRSMEAWADEAANAQPRWIPASERPPEDFKKVLVFWTEHSEPMIDTAFWVEDSKSFNCSHWERAGEKVTHWMPLPEPPKEV